MGEVYLAEHMPLGRYEALKILKSSLASDEKLAKRFRREARAANRVAHPNIVSIYDFGRLEDGRLYIAMEYAEGERVEDLLRRLGRLPLPRALRILAQLADAVDHAHACGVIHRDLKPANLILVEHLEQSDLLKVCDFGIAKIVEPGYQESMVVTTANSTYGTPLYMAPEMFTGSQEDPRIDLYAIGCLAFELVTGEPPFTGLRPLDLAHAHVRERPPRASERRPEAAIPEEFEEVVACCMEKDPERRYPTGAALLEAIRRVPGFKRESTSKRRRRFGAAGAPALLFSGETLDEERTEVVSREGFAGGKDLASEEVWSTVGELSAALLGRDCNDPDLLVAVAEVRDLEIQVDRLDQELSHIAHSRAEVERAAREREAQLRFALGELRFDMSRLGDEDLTVRRLEQRLAAVAEEKERDTSALADRELSLAADRDRRHERLAEQYAVLEHVLGEVAPRYEKDPQVAALWRRLLEMRG